MGVAHLSSFTRQTVTPFASRRCDFFFLHISPPYPIFFIILLIFFSCFTKKINIEQKLKIICFVDFPSLLNSGIWMEGMAMEWILPGRTRERQVLSAGVNILSCRVMIGEAIEDREMLLYGGFKEVWIEGEEVFFGHLLGKR